MTIAELFALAPFGLVALTALAIMAAIAIKRRHGLVVALSIGGLAAAFALIGVYWLSAVLPQPATSMLLLDNYACFYMAIILIAALVAVVLSRQYLAAHEEAPEELYLLLMVATLGGLILVASRHLMSFFLGLELLSMPMYGMAAYLTKRRQSLEAGLKYLILSAIASAAIAFGMALIYAQCGSMTLDAIAVAARASDSPQGLLMLGGALILSGVAFKLSLAPFHLWTPDVYHGAPAPVSAYLGSASKIAVFALLVRFAVTAELTRAPAGLGALVGLALLSIVAGNLLALRQDNLKRLLAYSGIAHFGYLMAALISGGPLALEAVAIYLLTYTTATLAAFGVISQSSHSQDRDADQIKDYQGLFWRRPLHALVLTVALLSLAGIPLTAGFIGKLYVLGASVNTHQWPLLAGVIFGSAVGIYYYLRTMIQLYVKSENIEDAAPAPGPRIRPERAVQGVLVLLLIAMLALGVYPTPFIALARSAGL